MTSKTALILSIGSDIGQSLAREYLALGYQLIGTYRTKAHVASFMNDKRCTLIPCDFSSSQSVDRFLNQLKKSKIIWDLFICCVGYLLPARPFFECEYKEWLQTVHINALMPLEVLHRIYPYRNKKNICDVVFFAGGGASNTARNLTAYGISKIMLMKMCECLDVENPDLNVFIMGPGWTKTKIHNQILKSSQAQREKVDETKRFLSNESGTHVNDIFECLEWLRQQGKAVSGGRNFSVVYDPWRARTRAALLKELKNKPEMYKLRRENNSFKQSLVKKV